MTSIRSGLYELGDPEEVHAQLERGEDSGEYFYYRLNDEAGIQIEMDEWKPRKVGINTTEKMKENFRIWLQRDGVEDKFRNCAKQLVELRRVRMTTPRWEQFALGQYFVCRVRNCPNDEDKQWSSRAKFETHLRNEHVAEDYVDLFEAQERCRQVWKYPPVPSETSP
ncbi:hypothetical protein NUW58_g9636 [Xylaria curta]|uniref:Uncharacterized protein n=1 Tax=Xylaria curta TaxID=42375 RepID=A0ACC1MVJ2_9PEZI|nr:hypothetical protein NUW58_g9636 [Xylaria curta]